MNPRQLAAYSKSLIAGNVVNMAKAKPDLLAQCLEQDRINAQGASVAAKRIVLTAVQKLPFIDLSALTGIPPRVRRLFLSLLENDSLIDPEIEQAIAVVRRAVLHAIATGQDVTGFGIDLIAALGVFGFHHEFVISESDTEKNQRALLQRDTPIHLAAIAMYEPLPPSAETRALLGELDGQHIDRLIRVQVDEPEQEWLLRSTFPTLASINNDISVSVQNQYEENPYPRWWKMSDVASVPRYQAKNILIAGCGTGWEAIEIALANPSAKLTALDLSLASLAYAKRQADKYGAVNISFVQGDILDIPASPKYDLIICSGVLHHMENPESGLRALRNSVQEQGTVRLALYSESGRVAVVQCIELRKQRNLPATRDGICELRREIYELPANSPIKSLLAWRDFYFVSDFRDLVFHVQEHRYTLPKIAALLEAGGLKFSRMVAPEQAIVSFSKEQLGDANDLAAWTKFEINHPGAFGSMYQFEAVPI